MPTEIRGEMLYYAIAFFSIAITAALYGLSGVTSHARLVGGFLFTVFLMIAIVCLVLSRK